MGCEGKSELQQFRHNRCVFAALLACATLVFTQCQRRVEKTSAPPAAETSKKSVTKPHTEPVPDSHTEPHRNGAFPPLSNATWLEKLELPDNKFAYVTPPLGAREPRPIIVGVHGAGDRPEWSCGGWRLACSDFAFVVCPAGTSSGGERYAWASAEQIRDAIEPALRATRERFGKYVADVPAMYAGFSQGATLARSALLTSRGRYSIVAFAEGGYDLTVNATFARELKQTGALRALLVCGNPNCFVHAKRAKHNLERVGLNVFISGDERSGHNLNERMQVALRRTWPELVRGLPGWETFRPALN